MRARACVSDARGRGTVSDSRPQTWDPRCVGAYGATGASLADKLPEIAPSHTVVGRVARALVERHGFDKRARVVCSSGDNPCTCSGLGLAAGSGGVKGEAADLALSLGASDALPASPGGYALVVEAPIALGVSNTLLPASRGGCSLLWL